MLQKLKRLLGLRGKRELAPMSPGQEAIVRQVRQVSEHNDIMEQAVERMEKK